MNREFKDPFIKSIEKNPVKIKELGDFDMEYFQELEGENGWLALGDDAYKNQKYFTVQGGGEQKLGIVGVYDTEDEKNVTHTVVDPSFRGQGLASQFKLFLMDKLGLDYITLTIDLDNVSSIRAAEKLPGVEKVSNEEYEKDYHKVKYIFRKPEKE